MLKKANIVQVAVGKKNILLSSEATLQSFLVASKKIACIKSARHRCNYFRYASVARNKQKDIMEMPWLKVLP